MATRIRYVNTASSGGNGTTSATSGATAAYATLAAAITAEKSDLTGITTDISDALGGVALEIRCIGTTTADTSRPEIFAADWGTDATHRLRIIAYTDATTPANHGGIYGGSGGNSTYRNEAGSWDNAVIYSTESYLTLEGLSITQTGSTTNSGSGVFFSNVLGCLIDRCIVKSSASAKGIGWSQGIRIGVQESQKCYIRNSLVYDFDLGSTVNNDQFDDCGIWVGFGVCVVHNCTIVNCSKGIIPTYAIENADETRCRNVLCYGNDTADFYGSYVAGNCTNNASSDTSAPGANYRRSIADPFVSAAGDNYHLAAGAAVIDYGADLSSHADIAVTVDIDGVTRTGTFDIGADEYVSSSSTPLHLIRSRQIGLSALAL